MGFSLLTNQREARFYGISRKIKGGDPKKTQEIGAFSTYSRKSPENQAFLPLLFESRDLTLHRTAAL
jgi:hypothetical protein